MIVTFAIGNSDDKLPQARWSEFVSDVLAAVDDALAADASVQIHFMGFAPAEAPWQNALWALDLGEPWVDATRGALRAQLAELCGKYGQDSIAWWQADRTEMIPPALVTP